MFINTVGQNIYYYLSPSRFLVYMIISSLVGIFCYMVVDKWNKH